MKLLLISLGCDKNLVDSEVMLGLLSDSFADITFTDDESEADVIVINTCCFIGDAKEESVNTILEMAEYKKSGRLRALIVTGCLAQRYKEEIMEEIEEVDALLGTTSYDEIARTIKEVLAGNKLMDIRDADGAPGRGEKRLLTTGGHYAYLKIAEGCDKCCTYCIIPKVRGSYRSIPMERLLAEAKRLAEGGVKELILVAQETTLYGFDLYGKKMLPELLTELCDIDGLEWIRLLYCYPEELTEELIEVMAREPKICHYLDIPIQHADNAILKRMGRRTTRKQLVDIIQRLRSKIPDITLRTTLISGFPGESGEAHERLMEFVDEMEFDRLGVFPYSPEEDTPAAKMPDQLPDEVKLLRRDELMELQQEIAFEKAQKMEGRILKVMIEGRLADEDVYVGRTYMDAPGVDGMIFVNTDAALMSGDFVTVKVTGAAEYDLIGVIVNEFAK